MKIKERAINTKQLNFHQASIIINHLYLTGFTKEVTFHLKVHLDFIHFLTITLCLIYNVHCLNNVLFSCIKCDLNWWKKSIESSV